MIINALTIDKKNKTISNLAKLSLEQSELIDALAFNDSLNLAYIGEKINPNTFVELENGQKVKFYSLIKSNTLFFKYSELSCSPCIQQEIQILKKFSNSMNNSNLFVLTSYEDIGRLYRFKRINEIENLTLINISDQQLFSSLSLEKEHIPFYFVVDSNLILSSMFVPDKTKPILTNRYLRLVNKYVLNN